MFRPIIGLASLLLLPACSLGQMTSEQAQEIIRQSAQATHADWELAQGFDFCEVDKAKKGSRTFAVLMIEGSPYNRLVQVNGDDLSPEQEAAEQKKLAAVTSQREHEISGERAKRIAEYQKERRRDQELIGQLTVAMKFTFAGTQVIGAHSVDVFEAEPRPGYVPTSMETQVLTGMKGKLWIDQKSFRWVEVRAEVVRPVSMVGFLARVEPGTRFELEEAPLAAEIWLPHHFAMQSVAKIAFLFAKSSRADETYFDYKPSGMLSADSCRSKNASSDQ